MIIPVKMDCVKDSGFIVGDALTLKKTGKDLVNGVLLNGKFGSLSDKVIANRNINFDNIRQASVFAIFKNYLLIELS